MRIIDADALMEYTQNQILRSIDCNDIARFPTIDAVPVVRCENCKYWNPRYETMGMCMKHNSIVTFTKPNFFCAWGEGKQK